MEERLSRYQAIIYLVALSSGLALGLSLPGAAQSPEPLVWPAVGLLLYVTFTRLDMREAAASLTKVRVLAAVLLANFGLVPLIVWGLGNAAPLDGAVRLGVFLVLLVPCTDWFTTFTFLGRGDVRLAVGLVPILLILQFLLLPLYLLAFLGDEFTDVVEFGPFAEAFLTLIVAPVVAAELTRLWARRAQTGQRWFDLTGHFPVPALAVVIWLIAATQAETILDEGADLPWALLVFAVYALLAAPLALAVSRGFRLGQDAGRTLAFSVGTRNSFVVLPLALALPSGWEAAAAVVVLQSFVELMAMIGYLRWVPDKLFPD